MRTNRGVINTAYCYDDRGVFLYTEKSGFGLPEFLSVTLGDYRQYWQNFNVSKLSACLFMRMAETMSKDHLGICNDLNEVDWPIIRLDCNSGSVMLLLYKRCKSILTLAEDPIACVTFGELVAGPGCMIMREHYKHVRDR